MTYIIFDKKNIINKIPHQRIIQLATTVKK